MLQTGASLRHVQELLGHSSISTTQVYTHMTSPHVRREYEKNHPINKRAGFSFFFLNVGLSTVALEVV
ncbi:MAG: hypothetical protein Ct9H300mP27_11580 [Chloroflexota bacterium]|nr:MAG: hypothetical protein Ct9H300mP27_11580 [Chloroflexota bacterium]